MENSLSISKREKDYILFNIRGFFRHYKLEQNINKISIDISNIQLLEQEVNDLLSKLNEYKEEFNKNLLNKNQTRKRLYVNRRKKLSNKSTDIAFKKINENKKNLRMRELKYDLNKSNLTIRPKTPDVSKLLNNHRNKKIDKDEINIKNLKNNIKENHVHNKSPYSKSFIQQKKYPKKFNTSINSTNNNKKNMINVSHNNIKTFNIIKPIQIINNKNKNTIKYNTRENSIDIKNNNNINNKTMNYTLTKFPKEYDNMKKKVTKKNINIISLNRNKNFKKINNLYDRYHSSDIIKKKSEYSRKKMPKVNNKINNIISPLHQKKIMKLNLYKRTNIKTPSPKNFRKASPLLIDHDTVIRNKNKKINYNGHYHSPSFNTKKNNNKQKEKNTGHFKLHSEVITNRNQKDITKEEEKKLDEIIINNKYDDENLNLNNNNKNILDLSQNILENLEYINSINDNNENNLFRSNYIESLFLAMNSGYMKPEEKIKLLFLSKELYFKYDIKNIIHDYINLYEKEIQSINKRINNYDINIINKPFIPRKTGINSLNFITKNEEQRLINESQHDYVIKIFQIILIFLNEDVDMNNSKNIFEFFFNDIYNKNQVNNIKDLFIKNFVDKIVLIDDERFIKVNEIIKEVPDLLSPSTLLEYNRNVSYLIFFLSELYNYFSFKTNDGIYYYQIRNDFSKLNYYINKINKIKSYL